MSKATMTIAVAVVVLWGVGSPKEVEATEALGPYSISVVMDGIPQPVYHANGQAYVAGAYGRAYQIRVNNASNRRIEVVVAVDGRDVVSGRPVDPSRQRGYIVMPYSSITIDGFRSSTSTVAAFRFSTIADSYAWRTGTTWGIGTIRAWVFEENIPVPVPMSVRRSTGRGGVGPRAPAPALDGAAEAAPQTMGTAYGEQRWSPVNYTTFVRRSSIPVAVLGLRYNSPEALAAAGILSGGVYAPVTPWCSGGLCAAPGFAPPPPPRPYRYGY